MALTLESEITHCQRCGKLCQSGVGNPEARPLRRAVVGYCADCAITHFIKDTEPLASIIAGGPWGPGKGPSILLNPHIQGDWQRLFVTGCSDADNSEINWQRVVELWDMPFPKYVKKAKG